jgi:hypothetical protein
MRLRGMKNTDIAKLKNSDHYGRFKKLKEDMDYAVDIEGLPKMYVKGKSPMDVKAILRKVIKKPDMIQNVERTTKVQLRKAFMLKAQGKDDLEEAKSNYQINHKTFSSAVQHALSEVEKQGYTVDGDEWDRKVATGPRKPSKGKTNSYTIDLMKDGKETKRKLQMQIYYDDNRYELNMYIS